jgi:DNA-binding CsgD family transcriptional regulator
MSVSVDVRVRPWLGFVSELVSTGMTRFPFEAVFSQVHETFECDAVTWNWADSASDFGVEFDPAFGPIPPHLTELWNSGEIIRRNGLLRWFLRTGSTAAQTLERVPSAINPPADRAFVREALEPIGGVQQLSMPYLVDPVRGRHLAIVVGRNGSDFSDDDLEVARLLQSALKALQVQADILGDANPAHPRAVPTPALTGRELSVLQLLADGYTADGIARRLGNSPRTVEKHLQNLYRKLEVNDRLRAVLVGSRHHLCRASVSDGPRRTDAPR